MSALPTHPEGELSASEIEELRVNLINATPPYHESYLQKLCNMALRTHDLQERLDAAKESLQTAAAIHNDLRQFHDACIKDMYVLLGIDGSDGEFRYKWCALEIAKMKRELDSAMAALRDVAMWPTHDGLYEWRKKHAAILAEKGSTGKPTT